MNVEDEGAAEQNISIITVSFTILFPFMISDHFSFEKQTNFSSILSPLQSSRICLLVTAGTKTSKCLEYSVIMGMTNLLRI